MAYIGVQPTDTYLSIASQQITGNGGATYTLDYSVSNEEDVAVFVNNVRQNVNTYTVSGTSLTLGGTISASDSCWVLFLGRTVGTKTPATGSVTNDMLAGSISPSKVSNLYPYRNLIINGDMSIAQRGTSVSGLTNGSSQYLIDRFRWYEGGSPTYQFTMSQDTNVPTGQGFAKSLKLACTTAQSSLGAGDSNIFYQRIEAQSLQHLKFGTSNAESLTLSFWVKSNKTGTYIIELYSPDGNRGISKSYTISSVDTWEKKTITYVGDTSGTINNDNGAGLDVYFFLSAGSNYQSGTLGTSWHVYSSAVEAVGQVNLADTVSNYWQITGVQLEVGTSASDFEFLPWDVNFSRCLRYYEKSYDYGITAGTVTESGSSSLNGLSTSSKQIRTHDTRFTVQKRTNPTVTIYDKSGNSGKWTNYDSGGNATDNNAYGGVITKNTNSFDIYASNSTATGYQFHYTADAEL